MLPVRYGAALLARMGRMHMTIRASRRLVIAVTNSKVQLPLSSPCRAVAPGRSGYHPVDHNLRPNPSHQVGPVES